MLLGGELSLDKLLNSLGLGRGSKLAVTDLLQGGQGYVFTTRPKGGTDLDIAVHVVLDR